MYRVLAVLLLVMVLPSVAPAQEESPTGTLALTVMVVNDDLELRPVPKWKFTLVPVDPALTTVIFTTSFSGDATIELASGQYMIRSEKQLEFEQELLSWDLPLTITEGEVLNLELSNDNARIEIATSIAAEVQMDEGDLYQAVRERVFKILSDSGHGSGFLVDVENGLVVTNHHVVANSVYLAVKVDHDYKYVAKIVAEDDINDVAILQVNPSVLHDLKAVKLAEDSATSPPCEVGDRVVAIGSPLATETILTSGLVSKIEADAIYSDVNINPGNSGGPLFNARREVIGINTFGLVAEGTPGIAGVIRIHLVHSLLATAYESDLASPPDPGLLPVESSFRFPVEELREQALSRSFYASQYHVEAGKFDVQLVTPVLVVGLQVTGERVAAQGREKRTKKKKKGQTAEYEPGQDFYEWKKYAGDYRAVVTVQAVPEIKMTGGSIFAVVMLGAYAPQKYKFKADFDHMELWRGETLVRPIHPRRWTNVVNTQQGAVTMNDIGYYGSYEYPPEAFRPGATLTLKVWKQGVPKPIVKEIPLLQQDQVWRDFEPYFAALEETVAAGG